jgi:hypothetical protein
MKCREISESNDPGRLLAAWGGRSAHGSSDNFERRLSWENLDAAGARHIVDSDPQQSGRRFTGVAAWSRAARSQGRSTPLIFLASLIEFAGVFRPTY